MDVGDLDVVVIDRSVADGGRHAEARLLAQLRDPPARRPVVAMTPALPPDHVRRSALRDRVKGRLIDEQGDGRTTAVVLVGPGGFFGKTTLAQEHRLSWKAVSPLPPRPSAFFVEFRVGEEARLARLETLLSALAEAKGTEQRDLSDVGFRALLDAEARTCLARDYPFDALVAMVGECEYELLGVRRLPNGLARIEFDPWAGPYGGTEALESLVRAFGHTVIRSDG